MTSAGCLRLLASTVCLVALTAVISLAQAFDPERTFTPGAFALSLGGGGGEQAGFSARKAPNLEPLDLWWVDARASWVPFGTVGREGPFYGALEAGLEPIYQQYFGRASGFWAGLGLAARYHFLALGRFVPYVEFGAAAGGTNLRVVEIDSSFAFRLYLGVGAYGRAWCLLLLPLSCFGALWFQSRCAAPALSYIPLHFFQGARLPSSPAPWPEVGVSPSHTVRGTADAALKPRR